MFACGLATQGYRPVFTVYSTFLQRCYDNILHDAVLQSLPVTVCIDRAGLAAGDGPTHHGIVDVAFLSEFPDIELYTPFDYKSQEECLEKAVYSEKPSFVRYPCGVEDEILRERFIYGDFGVRKDFSDDDKTDLVIITYGRIRNSGHQHVSLIDTGIISCLSLYRIREHRFGNQCLILFCQTILTHILLYELPVIVNLLIIASGRSIGLSIHLRILHQEHVQHILVERASLLVAERRVGQQRLSTCIDDVLYFLISNFQAQLIGFLF